MIFSVNQSDQWNYYNNRRRDGQVKGIQSVVGGLARVISGKELRIVKQRLLLLLFRTFFATCNQIILLYLCPSVVCMYPIQTTYIRLKATRKRDQSICNNNININNNNFCLDSRVIFSPLNYDIRLTFVVVPAVLSSAPLWLRLVAFTKLQLN